MAFSLSVGGFFAFLTRPFGNPIGWILMIGAGVWIWARLSGRIKGREKNSYSGGNADYIIK